MRLSVALLALLPPKLQALHRLRQSRGLYGLEHIVHGAGFKRCQRVLVVGGDKHDGRQRAVIGPVVHHLGGGFEPALARHADVEKQYIGQQRERLLRGAEAVCHHGLNLQLRPLLAQHLPQRLGQQRLVFGNQGARIGFWVHGAVFKAIVM